MAISIRKTGGKSGVRERVVMAAGVAGLKPVILEGSVETRLVGVEAGIVQTTVTSPPYFRQKDYHAKGQIGWESSVGEYVERLKAVFTELFRVTTESGSCFFIVGDTYCNKALQLVPQRLAIAASEVGWTLRNELIWSKSD